MAVQARVAVATVAVCALAAGMAAQGADDRPRFEVASVKPHVDTGSQVAGITENESLVRIGNLSLRAIIGIAHDVAGSRLVGPAWLDRRTFDITAKPPAGYQRSQMTALLQTLLAERFKLVTHREQRQVQGYALRVSTAGRLRPSEGTRTFLTVRPGLIGGNNRTLDEVVPALSRFVDAPVVDETGLKGGYDIKLEWTAVLAAGGAAGEPDVSIFTALREQLGLRLDPIRTTAEFLIVDAVEETPTPD